MKFLFLKLPIHLIRTFQWLTHSLWPCPWVSPSPWTVSLPHHTLNISIHCKVNLGLTLPKELMPLSTALWGTEEIIPSSCPSRVEPSVQLGQKTSAPRPIHTAPPERYWKESYWEDKGLIPTTSRPLEKVLGQQWLQWTARALNLLIHPSKKEMSM